jgi:hypothetical protein
MSARKFRLDCSVGVVRTGVLIIGLAISELGAQSASFASQSASAKTLSRTPGKPTWYAPSHFPRRAAMYYQDVWGVDSLSVRAVEAGKLIRFSYQILNPGKASPLNDKKFEPKLIAPASRVELIVPSLEKVGQLRQSNTPEGGRLYWMAFSNPRLTVKRGDRVNVVIGPFHADGLLVE